MKPTNVPSIAVVPVISISLLAVLLLGFIFLFMNKDQNKSTTNNIVVNSSSKLVSSGSTSTGKTTPRYKYIEQTIDQMEATLTGAVKYEMLVEKKVSVEEKFDPISMEMKNVDVEDYYGVGAPYWKYRVTFSDGKIGYYYNQGHIDGPTELLEDENIIK